MESIHSGVIKASAFCVPEPLYLDNFIRKYLSVAGPGMCAMTRKSGEHAKGIAEIVCGFFQKIADLKER